MNAYPGYWWNYTPEHGWIMQYNPIPNVYSPPILHFGIQRGYFYFKENMIPLMGSIIGKNGFHYKNITKMSGCFYIYNIGNSTVEIWGDSRTISKAIDLLKKHTHHVLQKYQDKTKYVKGFDHLQRNVRPLKLKYSNKKYF